MMTRIVSLLAIALFTMSVAAGPAATEQVYVVTLDPAAAVDGAEAMAARLAATYGGSVVEVLGERFTVRLTQPRVRLLAADPNVASVVVEAGDVSANAVTETVNWAAGVPYHYDGTGNIYQIGTDSFAYDAASRLVRAKVNSVVRDYQYDAPGNRQTCVQPEGNCQGGYSINTPDNRIKTAGYDAAGNVDQLGGHVYQYDALNMQTRDSVSGAAREFVYTANDERIAVYNVGSSWEWSLRDAEGKILREVRSSGAAGTAGWEWTKDYVWRDAVLLATRQVEPNVLAPTRYHYHVDHLGTPRRVTDARDRIVGVHDYHAFGPELGGGTNEPSLTDIKYTGHERDRDFDGSEGLDYMHARYYSSELGRFYSVDPGRDWSLEDPQSWNQYAYTRNNPLAFFDPDGEAVKSFQIITKGPNKVTTTKIKDLGLETTFNGFYLNFNLGIEFDSGDNLNDYTVERDAFIAGRREFRDRGKENPDDPGQIARDGMNMYVFDGPGLNITSPQGGPLPRSQIGSGKYVSLYEIRVVDKKNKTYDPKRYYYAIIITYTNGEVTNVEIGEITEEQYREIVKEKKKEKPHRK